MMIDKERLRKMNMPNRLDALGKNNTSTMTARRSRKFATGSRR
jgi:hypothetical protein